MSAIKFTGLSSGLDTQSIVEALLTPYQSKIDTATANKTKANWKKEIYNELSTKLNNLKKSAESLKLATNSSGIKASVSNSSAITVDTSGKYTGDSTHSIQVKQLATKASVPTKTITSDKVDKVTSTTSLDEILTDTDVRNATIQIGEATVNLKECQTVGDIVNAVNEVYNQGNTSGEEQSIITFDDDAGAFIIASPETGEKQTISLGDGSGTTLTENHAAYKAFAALGIGSVNEDGALQQEYKGTNAEILYNGSLAITSESNEFTVKGITFTAEAVTDQPVTVKITKDTEKITSAVKSFVEEYNSILKEVTTRLYADSAKDYDVLTDSEKESMSEKEIEQWEDKIKGSLLRNDSTLKSLYNSMRDIMGTNYDTGNKSYSMLAQIGISSSSWTDRGQLTIDEEQLASALVEDTDSVVNLLNSISSDLEQLLIKSSTSTSVRTYGQYFSDKSLTSQISSYETAIEKHQDRYDVMEAYYYKKFTSMETTLNSLNSTSSLFSNM